MKRRIYFNPDGITTAATVAAKLLFIAVIILFQTGCNDDGNNLFVGEQLPVGEWLQSKNMKFRLTLQANGNLVLKDMDTGTLEWRSQTVGKPAAYLMLLQNGNLVLFSTSDQPLWTSGTAGSGATELVLTDNGRLKLKKGDNVVWSVGNENNGGGNGDQEPNIILILVDDFPWYGTSVKMEAGNKASYTSYQRTPNIDKLANRGLTFSRAYASAPICGPSRACIQLGMTTARSRYTGNSGTGQGDQSPGIKKMNSSYLLNEPISVIDLSEEDVTVAEALKSRGYATAHFGKWHLWGGGPENHGYDRSDGETDNDDGLSNDPNDPKFMFSITRKSINFIRNQAANGKPFYVQLSHYAAHNKFQSLPKTERYYTNHIESLNLFSKSSDRRKAIESAAMIEDLDTTIGMLLDELTDLGIRNNTYIVFTSDNGKGWETGTNNLRGDKWWTFEDGIRVPMIVSGPGIPAGTRTATNVVQYDFLPTFFEWAGGDAATLPEIDGISLKSLMENPNQTPSYSGRNLYFHYPHNRTSTPQSAIIRGQKKLLLFYEHANRYYFYNLGPDQREAHNLGATDLAKSLKNDFMDYLDDVRADGFTLPVSNPKADASLKPVNLENLMPPRN